MPNINEKTARNNQIYSERVNGAQVVELAKKYDLSLPRIHRLCMQEENKVLKLENAKLLAALNTCQRKNEHLD